MPKIRKRRRWYQIQRLFDGAARKIMEVGKHEVLLQGQFYGPVERVEPLLAELDALKTEVGELNLADGGAQVYLRDKLSALHAKLVQATEETISVVLVPPSFPPGSSEVVSKGINAQLRTSACVLTSNITLAELREISAEQADHIIENQRLEHESAARVFEEAAGERGEGESEGTAKEG